MNEVMNNILTRRSIRKFTDTPISREILDDLVQAALHAPSGMGKQTWKFTVVTNKNAIKRLDQNHIKPPGIRSVLPGCHHHTVQSARQ